MSASPRPPTAKLSRAEFFTLLGAVFAVFPIVFCAMRVLVVSEGDPNTLRVLVQNLDLKTLVLATILPLGGTVVFWIQVTLWLFAYAGVTKPEYRRLVKAAFFCLLPITGAIVWVAMPRGQLLVCVGLLVVALLTVVAHQQMAEGKPRDRVTALGGMVFIVTVVALLISFVSNDTLWLPWETIEVKGRPTVDGYVLSSDGEWTRFMVSLDRTIHVVRTSEVKSRTVIDR
ncbi:hypothetical protein C6A86_018210 [Mycobacterium sp. ITM-2016-00316]|uniref:hypothetical protein n=1 Tax=Mycobacterium sp. ITM-2016-00316 TaxID=2099695 RepID=UPI000CF89555|nr:hypothetical protein [Mycobacterium sp. ITM-2016-00316]WNG80180.1 hypothetical protein C6A86_018210 [Mycobacterium sp. ITM-2016-00316]